VLEGRRVVLDHQIFELFNRGGAADDTGKIVTKFWNAVKIAGLKDFGSAFRYMKVQW
jgi:hypothetical protein